MLAVDTMTAWAGRRVRQLVDQVLAWKGTICWLCGLDGADSADHDPPRSQLVRAGVPNPDDLRFLFPSHRFPCNVSRKARPVTAELRTELRHKRLQYVARMSAAAARSPRFTRRFFDDAVPAEGDRKSVV